MTIHPSRLLLPGLIITLIGLYSTHSTTIHSELNDAYQLLTSMSFTPPHIILLTGITIVIFSILSWLLCE